MSPAVSTVRSQPTASSVDRSISSEAPSMFAEIVVHDRHIANHEYKEPFRLFLEGLTGQGRF